MGSGNAAAGWYDDAKDKTRVRYWDGSAWTDNFAPKIGEDPLPFPKGVAAAAAGIPAELAPEPEPTKQNASTNQELIAEINAVRFTPTKFRAGYDQSEVDDFLDELCAALAAGTAVGELIDGARFQPTKWREGYDQQEVDRFLDRVRGSAHAV